MVNPYINRQRLGTPAQQSKPTSQVSLGQSQALKKFESIQRKQQKAELKKIKKEAKSSKVKKDKNLSNSLFDTTSSDDSDDESSSTSDDTSDSVLKNVKSKSNKFLKKVTNVTKKSASDDSDDEDEKKDDDDDEKDESIKEETFRYSDISSQNVVVIPSSNKQPSLSSPLSSARNKGNRVKFETRVSRKNKSQSDITEISTTNIEENSETSDDYDDAINKNVIFDINDLDVLSYNNKNNNKKSNNNKKETVSIIKKSNKKESSIVEYNSSDESISSMHKNVILDIDDLDNQLTNLQKPKQSSKYEDSQNANKPPLADKNKKSVLNKKPTKSKRRGGSRSHSIVSQDSDSIATEIINENIETEDSIASETFHTVNDSSHRVATVSKPKTQSYASNYQEDFDTESDVSKIQSVLSKSNIKSSSIAPRPKQRHHEASPKKSVEIQVNDVDLLKNSNLFPTTPLFTPFSVASKQIDLSNYLDLNVANNAFSDLMKMNLDFMKNFINIQRQMYENEMRNLQQELNQ